MAGHPFTRLNEQERRVSESQSEVSSVDTELSDRYIATRLGLPDAEDIKTVRFKIDRQKLEAMIRSELLNL